MCLAGQITVTFSLDLWCIVVPVLSVQSPGGGKTVREDFAALRLVDGAASLKASNSGGAVGGSVVQLAFDALESVVIRSKRKEQALS